MEVSVIIPIFNQEDYLRECLESAAVQKGIEYEVILINDGSMDGSEEICLEYARKYSHFRYVHQENKGLGEARNKGLSLAQGKYIFFLDSDDAILKNSLQKLVLFAEEKDADIVYFDEIVCNENLAVQSIAKTYPGMDIRIDRLKALELSMHPSHIWARLYRQNLFGNIRFASIWYEDMELFPKLLARAEKLYYYKVPIYYYRQHRQGITRQDKNERNLDVITAWSNVYPGEDYSGEERQALEICIKESVFTFMFFRPKYAAYYAEFYNRVFAEREDIFREKDYAEDRNIENMPLWQQADFYVQRDILDILKGLKAVFMYGGILRFYENGKVVFRKEAVPKEQVVFSADEKIVLKELRLEKRNPAVSEVLNECAKWNLVSLKNQLKEFQIAKLVIKKAILYGIRMDWRV